MFPDAVWILFGYKSTERTEIENEFTKLKSELEKDKLILDGNYTRSIPIKWKNVEAAVRLDYPFLQTLLCATR